MADKNGFCRRDRSFFEKILDFEKSAVVYKESGQALGYILFDGYYYETCINKRTLESVPTYNGREIYLPSPKLQRAVTTQMIHIFDPSLKEIAFAPNNVNFDRYF
jgi:hypothetical protein